MKDLFNWLSGKEGKQKIENDFNKTEGAVNKMFSIDQYNPAIAEVNKNTQALTQDVQMQNEKQKAINAPKMAQFLARTGSVSTPQVNAVLGGMMKDADARTQTAVLGLKKEQADKVVGIINALVHNRNNYLASLEGQKLTAMSQYESPLTAILRTATSFIGGAAGGAAKAGVSLLGGLFGKDKKAQSATIAAGFAGAAGQPPQDPSLK